MLMVFVFIDGLITGVGITALLFYLTMKDVRKRHRTPQYNRMLFNKYYSKKY